MPLCAGSFLDGASSRLAVGKIGKINGKAKEKAKGKAKGKANEEPNCNIVKL